MNKSVRNFFWISASIIAFFILIIIKDARNKNPENSNSDFKPSYKESASPGDFSEHLDSTTLIYSNYRYGVAMDFPNNWEIDRGVSEHTIIRGGRKDSAISFAINVVELDDTSSSEITIWDLWDNEDLDLENIYLQMMIQAVNSEVHDYQFRKVYVSNREAMEIRFNYVNKDVDAEYNMQAIVYSIIIVPFTYTIGIHIPELFYYLNQEKYNYLI